MANTTNAKPALSFDAHQTPDDELATLRRTQATFESILTICRRGGYDGSTTLAEFIESHIPAK